MVELPPCVAEASKLFNVAQARIAEIMANGLPPGQEQAGRVGPMAIPIEWLPIFENMGIPAAAIRTDTCQNIIAGTWIYSFQQEFFRWQQGGYQPDVTYSVQLPKSIKARRQQWAPVVQAAAASNGISPALVDAVIAVESRYNPGAVSSAGAIGMMQLMPGTASMLRVNARDPVANIYGGTAYLAQLLRRFNGDVPLSLAAYNAGPASVSKYGYKIPPFAETKAYVPKVLSFYNSFLAGN